MKVFDKTFYKFISDFREYNIRIYETGVDFLNNLVLKYILKVNEILLKQEKEQEKSVQRVLDEILLDLKKEYDDNDKDYKSQIMNAGRERMDAREELARDIPEVFKQVSLEKCELQFFLSAIMHIIDIAMFELSTLSSSKSLTDKNLKSLPIVKYLLKF